PPKQTRAPLFERRQAAGRRRERTADRHVLDPPAAITLRQSRDASIRVGPALSAARSAGRAFVWNGGAVPRYTGRAVRSMGQPGQTHGETNVQRPRIHATVGCENGPAGQDATSGPGVAVSDFYEVLRRREAGPCRARGTPLGPHATSGGRRRHIEGRGGG